MSCAQTVLATETRAYVVHFKIGMKLLSLGLELLRHYENKLAARETVSPQDLRLATWAVETTYRQRHHVPAFQHVLSVLNSLRLHTVDFERDGSNAEAVHTTLSKLNEHLEALVTSAQSPPPRVEPDGDPLHIPRTILHRLRSDSGIDDSDFDKKNQSTVQTKEPK